MPLTPARAHRSASPCADAFSSVRIRCRPTSLGALSPARRRTGSTSSAPRPAQRRVQPAGGRRGDRGRRPHVPCRASSTARGEQERSTRSSSRLDGRRPRRSTRDPQRSDRCAAAAHHRGARAASQESTGLPVGLHVQGAAGTGLLNAVVATRVGADLIASAVYPLALILHRVAGQSLVEALHGLGAIPVSTSLRCGLLRTSSTS